MPLALKNLHAVDTSGPYIFERDVDVPLKTAQPGIKDDPLLVRANVYRPHKEGKYPVLCTYGPCECVPHMPQLHTAYVTNFDM